MTSRLSELVINIFNNGIFFFMYTNTLMMNKYIEILHLNNLTLKILLFTEFRQSLYIRIKLVKKLYLVSH